MNVGESVSIELQLESESPKQSKFQLQATRLDAAAFSEFVSVMNREPFSLTKFGKRGFEGTVDLDKERVLMFSILADQGWSAVVDGQDAPIELIDGAFIALRIPAGQHHIEMHYVPAGFTTGLYVTLVGLALLLLLTWWERHKAAGDEQIVAVPYDTENDLQNTTGEVCYNDYVNDATYMHPDDLTEQNKQEYATIQMQEG